MIIFPTTLKEIQALIDNEIQESLHLDYKEARAVGKASKQKSDFAKDASAFANSDGGVLIYGIQEKGHLPVAITGIDHSQFSREFIEQTIRTNISSPSPNFTVIQIPINKKESVYVVKVEKSFGTPHQRKEDKKFYRRYNFESVAMENYEIEDVRNRRQGISPLVNISTEIIESDVFLIVSNNGNQIAQNIVLKIPESLKKWAKENEATIFLDGMKYLSPKQSFRYYLDFAGSLFNECSNVPLEFDISTTYFHPAILQNHTEIFNFDLKGYSGTISYKEEVNIRAEKIESALKDLTGEVKKLNENLSNLSNIANPTGLNISHTALRNLKNTATKKKIEKIPIPYRKYRVFQEVLGVDYKLSLSLRTFFSSQKPLSEIKNVEGITEKVINDIKT
jgi:Putative DNA-binding domain